MNLLLDTHIALWAITASNSLTREARDLIQAPDNTIWISAASIWEISIKHALGRGDMPVSGENAVKYFQQSGYQSLPVTAGHAAAVETLPSHHNDPFDRMLIAQALVEPMRLLTRDPQVAAYSNTIITV